MSAPQFVITDIPGLLNWLQTLLQAKGCTAKEADIVAHNLLWNSLIGRDAHGLSRLELLLQRIKLGLIQTQCQLQWTDAAAGLKHCDGGNGLGQFIGHQAMLTAIKMAELQGIAAVSVTNSNWNGSGAYFVQLAAESQMIGFCCSNGFAKVPAYRGDQAVFGTNPLAFGAPRANGKSLLIDMSTSNWSGAQVRQAQQDKQPVLSEALQTVAGAKGYGLALLVETLSALLSGAGLSTEVSSLFSSTDSGGRSGQFFLALNIRQLLPLKDFYTRMDHLSSLIYASGGEDCHTPILPGDRRWQAWEKHQQLGLALPEATCASLKRLGFSHPTLS